MISTQSLEAIAKWFDLSQEECRRRLRANLQIEAPHAFWEDQLVGREFSIGGVTLRATGVCQRCVVPARDTRTGEPTVGFQKRFAQERKASLPAESPKTAFDHYYRAALNTQLASPPGMISVGDSLLL